jgi:hypothetical protein
MDQDYMYTEEILLNRSHLKQVHLVVYKVQISVHYDQVLKEDHLMLE